MWYPMGPYFIGKIHLPTYQGDYSKNHIKSATFALHAFRQLLTQFLSDFHEIWQALFSSLTATSLKILRKNIM